jgi:Protein of unknown function (DUF2950)
METVQRKPPFSPARGISFFATLLAATILVFAWSAGEAGATSPRLFSTPEDALKALHGAAQAKDKAALDQIFGSSYKDLLSGDEVQDAAEFAEFVEHLAEKTNLVKESDSKVTLYIGNENWPFPIPIAKKDGQWFFDTEAGREEILNRRVGEDELIAILVCRSYVKAQRDYALKDREGDGVVKYAQKLRSDPGKKNGLFWRSRPGEEVSPLGELVAQARMEGYRKTKAVFREESTPFHGYFFKIMTRQGKNAPGGEYNYIINGNMVAGFALVASPSNWGKSGVMTFIVSQQGKVYQKNLGPNTLKIAQAMEEFNPDKTWTLVKE